MLPLIEVVNSEVEEIELLEVLEQADKLRFTLDGAL